MDLPKSLLNQQHNEWLKQAQKILDNLQYHIDQAKRADVPGMDEHQTTKNDLAGKIAKLQNVYFPHG